MINHDKFYKHKKKIGFIVTEVSLNPVFNSANNFITEIII